MSRTWELFYFDNSKIIKIFGTKLYPTTLNLVSHILKAGNAGNSFLDSDVLDML